MQMYETLYIVQPGMPEGDAEALGKTFEDIVVSGEGNLVKTSCWGKRKLAYLVKKHQEGLYFHLQYEAEPPVIAELERRLRNHEEVLKYLSIRLDRTAIKSLAAAEKKAEERAAARAVREAERAARQQEAEDAAAASKPEASEATTEASKPAAEASKPAAEASKPVAEASKPVAEASKPVAEAAAAPAETTEDAPEAKDTAD